MAEAIISPGVFTRENDQSFLSQQPIQAGAALIGPTVKGPVEIPTVVTSYSEYKNKFGATFESGSGTSAQSFTFLTSIAAYNYFQNGGDTLLVTRVVRGDFQSAEATINDADNTEAAFKLATQGKGDLFNNDGIENSDGTLDNGTKDNIRWEIVSRDATAGTFTLAIRRGDDKTNAKTVLETYSNVSLDPYSDNYIEKAIGNQVLTKMTDSDGLPFLQLSGSYNNRSNYVYVKEVNQQTPNYFDNSGNAKADFIPSIPAKASGSFTSGQGVVTFGQAGNAYYHDISDGENIQGLLGSNYADAIKLLKNRDAYQFNSLIVPGLLSSMTGDAAAALTDVASLSIERGDFLGVIDMVAYGQTNLNNVTSEAGTYDNSYLATYWPWCQVQDPDLGRNVWVPASTLMPGVFAFNDNNAEPWFAPAGLNRGALSTVLRTERILTKNDRDVLYSGKVNPIATFPNAGVVVFGQKTLQQRASALDRVNVRRLLIQLKGFIGQLAQNLVFEQNTIATRNSFLSQVNPYLETVQQRQGLYAFRVVMDDSNNTPDVVDRNQLVGQIFLQPTKTAEFIVLDFNVLPTGAEFPA